MEFYAEMDMLVGVSLSRAAPGASIFSQFQYEQFPLGIDIYDTGIDPLLYENPLNV